jgi:large subunit ribosomal protein L25
MELTVTKREKKSPKNLRKEGILPAVIYGRKEESTPISVNRKDFEKLFRAAGESTVITLTGLGSEKDALIHEVDFDPVLGTPIHADFYAIEKGQTVTVSVPIEFDGVSPAVKELGGILVKVMHELEIEVLPKELPHAFHVDISTLKTLDDQILIKDLKLPPSAIVTLDLDEVVAMISIAQDEPINEAPMDLSQIEVEKKGKKEEETPAAEE